MKKWTISSCTGLHRLHLEQDDRGAGGGVREEHAVVDRHVGGDSLLEDLLLVGEDYGAIDGENAIEMHGDGDGGGVGRVIKAELHRSYYGEKVRRNGSW